MINYPNQLGNMKQNVFQIQKYYRQSLAAVSTPVVLIGYILRWEAEADTKAVFGRVKMGSMNLHFSLRLPVAGQKWAALTILQG